MKHSTDAPVESLLSLLIGLLMAVAFIYMVVMWIMTQDFSYCLGAILITLVDINRKMK